MVGKSKTKKHRGMSRLTTEMPSQDVINSIGKEVSKRNERHNCMKRKRGSKLKKKASQHPRIERSEEHAHFMMYTQSTTVHSLTVG